jgi:parallel beta-helix repeat protein
LANTYDLGGNTLVNSSTAVNAADVPNLQQVQGLVANAALPLITAPLGASLVGFQQAGTGAAARTLAARGKEAVSITDFTGVDPTGATDSAAGIQAALNAHAGKIIRVPSGVYLLGTTLLIPSNTHLIGDGKGRSVCRATAALSLSTPLIKNTNQPTPGAVNGFVDSNICFEGITFDGGSYAGRTIALGYFWKVNGIEFERCEFTNSTYMGLAVIACEAPRIIDNYFHGCGNPVATHEGGASLYVAGTVYDGSISQNAEITLNRFENNRWSHMSLGLTKSSVSFNSCLNGGESGIFATQCSHLNLIGNTIDGQTMVDIAASGIELDNSNHCLIAHNTAKNCGADGISSADCQFVTIANNNCLNNGKQHASVPAFAHAAGIGIAGTLAAPNGPNHINIRGNTCVDNQATHTQQHGVELIITGSSPAVSNLVIDGNDFTGCAVSDINAPAGSIGSDGYIANNTTRTAQRQAPVAVLVVQAPAATGNAAITGVGFRPRAVEVSFSLSGTGTVIHGTGVFDGSSQGCDFIYQDATGRASGQTSGYFVNAADSAANVVVRGSVSSLDVDGCTINWTSVASRCWMVLRFYR